MVCIVTGWSEGGGVDGCDSGRLLDGKKQQVVLLSVKFVREFGVKLTDEVRVYCARVISFCGC